MTLRVFGLGPRKRMMLEIPQQPQPPLPLSSASCSERLQAPTQSTIRPFSRLQQQEHLMWPGGILTAGQMLKCEPSSLHLNNYQIHLTKAPSLRGQKRKNKNFTDAEV